MPGSDPIRFEIEHGRSAKIMPLRCLDKLPDGGWPEPSASEWDTMLSVQEAAGALWDLSDPPGLKSVVKELRKQQGDEQLWPLISASLWNPKDVARNRQKALCDKLNVAKKNGWHISNNFCPDVDWLTFGWEHAEYGYKLWYFARHGDHILRRPANVSFDMLCIAFMAITDGLLAKDIDLLNMAWACWPAKRDSIYSYDQTVGAIAPYRPSWHQ